MSDTSILTAIKYKGKMINLPGDSSVSWNDLTDKPVVIDTSTKPVTHYYDIASYQPIRNLKQRGYGFGDNDSYSGVALYVDKESITNAINALSSQLTGDQKNIWRIEFYEEGVENWEIEATINIKTNYEKVLYFSGDKGITLNDDYLDEDGGYWKILVNDPQRLLDVDINVSVDIIPVNFITRDGQTVTSLTYTETITVPGQWYFDPDHVKKDASLGILWDTSMNGGSTDLSDYYTKTQIDTSIANNYASKNDISAFITSNDVSIYLTSNDVSQFVSKSDVSALDSSVSWNDLTDKPTTKTFIGYDVYENNINTDFPAAVITPTNNSGMLSVNIKKNIMEFIVNPTITYYNGTYTDKDGNTQTLSDWQKQFVTIVCYKNGVYRTKMIIKLKSDYTYEMILFESFDVEIYSLNVHAYSEDGAGSTQLRITFTFNSQDYNYSAIGQEITDGYWKVVATDKVYSEKFLPSVIDTSNLVSKSELYDLSTGIVNNYYTKTQIDTSIANNYASKSSVTNIDTSVSQLWDTSTQGSGSGISLQYLTQAQYNALHTKDPNTLYLIEVTV